VKAWFLAQDNALVMVSTTKWGGKHGIRDGRDRSPESLRWRLLNMTCMCDALQPLHSKQQLLHSMFPNLKNDENHLVRVFLPAPDQTRGFRAHGPAAPAEPDFLRSSAPPLLMDTSGPGQTMRFHPLALVLWPGVRECARSWMCRGPI
jgi:hypothetical protein